MAFCEMAFCEMAFCEMAFCEKPSLGIYVETAVAQNGAFTVAPNDCVTHKAADPDKEAD